MSRFSIVFWGSISNCVYGPPKNNRKSAKIIPKIDEPLISQLPPYAASKGGLVSLTHELAISLAPDIRVNCISPGWIDTHHIKITKHDHAVHPVGRAGKPEDIAHLVSFLISDQASFITGQNFIADGGMTVKMIYK